MKYVVIFIFSLSFAFTSLIAQQVTNHTFTYIDSSDTVRSVAVAGSFNNWNPQGYELIKNKNAFSKEFTLVVGYFYYKLVVNGVWITDPSNPLKVNDGGTGNNSIVKIGEPSLPKRFSKKQPVPLALMPRLFFSDSSTSKFISLYNYAWKSAWEKIQSGTENNGFTEEYMDEGFNELIYQWDSNFLSMFGMYSNGVFPAMQTLDNFYKLQSSDGYIQRVYWEYDGQPANKHTPDEPMVNPPLFAWTELRYANLTGDTNRIRRVLPHLISYYNWMQENLRNPIGKGLYYTTELGSGMDNTPREGVGKAGWLDLSAQQVLAAESIAQLALLIDDASNADVFSEHAKELSLLINTLCYSNETSFYHDLKEDGSISKTRHIGAFWTLTAGITDSVIANQLHHALNDETDFKSYHRVPSLSMKDPNFNSKGHYWKGGVWAPTNFAVIKGLERYGYDKTAYEISLNHLERMYEVFFNGVPDTNKVPYEQRFADGYHTIWETYSPTLPEPSTRWDDTYYTRQEFTGWSAVGPITLLIENILGIRVNAIKNEVTFILDNLAQSSGISNLRVSGSPIQLFATNNNGVIEISVNSAKPFTLILKHSKKIQKISVEAGINHYSFSTK